MVHRRRPAVLLVHGSADSPAAWQAVRALLEPEVEVHAPALPPLPPEAGPEITALDVDLPWLSQQMAASGARVLVAHSYGALAALRWAVAHPQELDALVLAEPICWGLIRGDGPADVLEQLSRCVELFQAGEAPEAVEWLVDYWNGPGFWAGLPPRIRHSLLHTAPRTAAEVRSGNQDRTSPADLQRLPARTRLLCATGTTAASLAVQRAFAAARPDVQPNWAHGGTHQFLRSHAELIAQVVRDVLS